MALRTFRVTSAGPYRMTVEVQSPLSATFPHSMTSAGTPSFFGIVDSIPNPSSGSFGSLPNLSFTQQLGPHLAPHPNYVASIMPRSEGQTALHFGSLPSQFAQPPALSNIGR